MTTMPQNRADKFREMLVHGASIVEEIEADVQRLAEKMTRIHGGETVRIVDHEPNGAFILIRVKAPR